ncbi:MAG: DUF1338 family protein [Caldilineales bacterium]
MPEKTDNPPAVSSQRLATLDIILGGLMRRYKTRVPDVQAIIDAMVAAGIVPSGFAIENDHIAFRTMGVAQLGVASLEKVFLHCGYRRRDPFRFPGKKLAAWWYSPPLPVYRASSSANCW